MLPGSIATTERAVGVEVGPERDIHQRMGRRGPSQFADISPRNTQYQRRLHLRPIREPKERRSLSIRRVRTISCSTRGRELRSRDHSPRRRPSFHLQRFHRGALLRLRLLRNALVPKDIHIHIFTRSQPSLPASLPSSYHRFLPPQRFLPFHCSIVYQLSDFYPCLHIPN